MSHPTAVGGEATPSATPCSSFSPELWGFSSDAAGFRATPDLIRPVEFQTGLQELRGVMMLRDSKARGEANLSCAVCELNTSEEVVRCICGAHVHTSCAVLPDNFTVFCSRLCGNRWALR